MTTYTWIGRTGEIGGDWNTASSWLSDSVPNASDANVLIVNQPVTIDARGTITAGSITLDNILTVNGVLNVVGLFNDMGGQFVVDGGTVTLAALVGQGSTLDIAGGILELQGPISAPVAFSDTPDSLEAKYGAVLGYLGQVPVPPVSPGPSTFILENPSTFTGTIFNYNLFYYQLDDGLGAIATVPQSIEIPGLSPSDVEDETYAGDASGGTLTLLVPSGTISLKFAGDYSISDFALTAGTFDGAPSLKISDPTIHLVGTAPFLTNRDGARSLSITGNQSNSEVILGSGNQTISLIGQSETILVQNYFTADNDIIFGPSGNSTISVGAGNQVIVATGTNNSIDVYGGSGTSSTEFSLTPSALGAFNFIDAAGGQETISAGLIGTAGPVSNIINVSGYSDNISVGSGLNLIFATQTDPNAAPVSTSVGAAGHTSITLAGGDNFVYLHGADNDVTEGGGTDAIWGGTGGGDTFQIAASGGALFVENFGNGDLLDLTKVLAGVSLASDLSNIGNFIKVVSYGADDQVFGVSDGGSKTVLQIVGNTTTAYVNLENVGSLTVSSLLSAGDFLLPNH